MDVFDAAGEYWLDCRRTEFHAGISTSNLHGITTVSGRLATDEIGHRFGVLGFAEYLQGRVTATIGIFDTQEALVVLKVTSKDPYSLVGSYDGLCRKAPQFHAGTFMKRWEAVNFAKTSKPFKDLMDCLDPPETNWSPSLCGTVGLTLLPKYARK